MQRRALDCTCVEGTAEVRAAVALAPARAASLSSGCIVTALTPHAQLFVAALLILRTRLGEGKNVFFCFFFFLNVPMCVLGFNSEH